MQIKVVVETFGEAHREALHKELESKVSNHTLTVFDAFLPLPMMHTHHHILTVFTQRLPLFLGVNGRV